MVLIGPPGSGKTTQAKYFSRKHRVPSFNMADLLKREIGRKSDLGKRLKVALGHGEFAGDELANELVKYRLERPDCQNGFILDGYPRTSGQAQFLDRLLEQRGLPRPAVVHLETPDRLALERMRTRGRADDREDVMERRLSDYHQERDAVLEWYAKGSLHRVDGAKSPAEVTRAIEQALR